MRLMAGSRPAAFIGTSFWLRLYRLSQLRSAKKKEGISGL